ncbi:MAG TPA: energy transducer TonB [Pyrinomonadaceae bacterium]|nr:energy transducer TonB [Pyrinomonadaceae bacterium]
MLDKLIESKNNRSENRRLGGFLFSTFTVASAVLTFALLYSLFTYNVALGGNNLDISDLIAPVKTAEQTPPAEQPAAAQKQQSTENTSNKPPSRRDNILRVNEMPTRIPTTISVVQNQQAARPNSRFSLDDVDSDLAVSGLNTGDKGASGNGAKGIGISDALKSQSESEVKAEVAPPPIVKTEPKKIEPEKKKTTISTGGVVNGKALTLVKPEYSKAAQAVKAAGEVKVQVTIDEDGNVISASAVSGHPLLKSSAVSAARRSKFSPTFLSKVKVKVTGIIVYNFKQQ